MEEDLPAEQGGCEEDVQEFLNFFLNMWHEELLASDTHAAEVTANNSLFLRTSALTTFQSYGDSVETGGENCRKGTAEVARTGEGHHYILTCHERIFGEALLCIEMSCFSVSGMKNIALV